MEIADKVFVVTGGGSGLGAATARALSAAGGRVVLADVNAELGTAVAADIGPAARFAATDVTDEHSVQRAIDLACRDFGALHGAVNCAGVGVAMKTFGRSGVHPADVFERTVRVNLFGTFNVVRLAAARMAGQAPDASGLRGVIVNTASVAAYDGQVGQVAYAASKGGIVAMTLPAARDLAPVGIRVVTIAPGLFDTPLLAALPEAARTALGAQVPCPSRLGRPAEFAALVRHIVENDMLNGEVIRLDGALRMPPK
jgi:NAD(P)-dependent dehydrogenase (short-subunit alcohol dehydrogenase family)